MGVLFRKASYKKLLLRSSQQHKIWLKLKLIMHSLFFSMLVFLFTNNVCESKSIVNSDAETQENNLLPNNDIKGFKNAINLINKEETVKEPTYVLFNMNSKNNITEIYNGCGKSKSCIGFPENCFKQMNCALFLSRFIMDDQYIWTLFSKARVGIKPSHNYIAVGLSSQDKGKLELLLTCTNKFSLFNVTSDFDHQFKETGVEDYRVANNEDIKMCTFKTNDDDMLLKMKLRMMAGGAFEDIQIVTNKNRMLRLDPIPRLYYILPSCLFLLFCGLVAAVVIFRLNIEFIF